MILSVLLSTTLTFTATATGVEKGTPVEFILAGPNTDRDYESMFLLDEPVEALCKRIEEICPRGTPVDPKTCRLWPTGCRITFEPPFERFVRLDQGKDEQMPVCIYTGGMRRPDDSLEAADVMPAAFFATYSLPQSPIVYADPVDQGSAYGRYTAALGLEKGKKYTFRMVLDECSMPTKLNLTAEKGRFGQLLEHLKAASVSNDVDAIISFSERLTVQESIAIAKALAVIDSHRVKINGTRGLFYRAFLPLEKWRDRQERLQQPFELTLRTDGTDDLLFIEEDWTVEGNDPKLTPRQIPYSQLRSHPNADTCFIYASKNESVGRLVQAMKQFPANICNWYVFTLE